MYFLHPLPIETLSSLRMSLWSTSRELVLECKSQRPLLGHPEFLLNIVFMDICFVPLKEGRHAKGAGQALQNYVRASRIPKKKFVAK
jgi:hypothetical protein